MQLAYDFRAVSALTVPCSGLGWGAFRPRLGLPFGFRGERINTKLYLIDSLRIHNPKARIRFPSFCGHFGSMHGRSIKTK